MTETAGETDAKVQMKAESHRLHPLTLLLSFIALIPSIGFALVAMGWTAFDSELSWLIPLIVPAAFAIPMAINWLAWSRFSYVVGAEDIRIQSGVLSRKNRSIPYERIQDVSVEQKFFARLFGLATVKIETGGSGGDEDALDAVSLEEAERLRDLIRNRKAGLIEVAQSDSASQEASTEEEAEPIFAMDNQRVFTAGLFNFSFILLAVIGTIAQNLDFLLPGEMFDPRYWAGLWFDQEIVNGLSLGTRILGIAGALISLIGVGIFSGMVLTFLREYDFRLERVQNGFRRRRGLVTLTDMVMPIHRVQAAILKTGPIRERFGWHHLKFQSLASDASGETDHSAAPCAKMDEIDPILAETNISNAVPNLEFEHVHPAMWWRNALLLAILIGIVSTANALFVHPAFHALLLVWIPITGFLFLGWRRHRFALTDTQLFVHTGWWRRKLTILPVRKIQTIDVSQSPFDHPFNLATVTLGVAGGSSVSPLRIHDIPTDYAKSLRDRLLSS